MHESVEHCSRDVNAGFTLSHLVPSLQTEGERRKVADEKVCCWSTIKAFVLQNAGSILSEFSLLLAHIHTQRGAQVPFSSCGSSKIGPEGGLVISRSQAEKGHT